MTLLEQMQRECPQAIKGIETMPSGQMIPIVGTVRADGSNDIDPSFWDLMKRQSPCNFQ